MSVGQSYEEAVSPLTARLRNLFTPPETPDDQAATMRGASDLPAELVAERAETLAETLQQVGDLTSDYLERGSPSQQEAAEVRLLAQASQQVQLARELLELADDETSGPATGMTTRSARALDLQHSLDELVALLESPLEQSLAPATMRGVEERPNEPELARADLQQEVERSLAAICRQAGSVGGQAAQTLLLMDAAILKQGVSLISKELGEVVDKLVSEAGRVVKKLLVAALRLLAQAYDWVVALLGKEAEQQGRKQVASWIDELRQEQPEGEQAGLAQRLVLQIYRPEVIKQEVAGWLTTSQAGVEQLNQAAEAVAELSRKYEAKLQHVRSFLKVIGMARVTPLRLVRTPQVQVLIAAVALGLLGYIVYTGYDHVDSGRATFLQRFGVSIPDRVEGVRETVQKALGAV